MKPKKKHQPKYPEVSAVTVPCPVHGKPMHSNGICPQCADTRRDSETLKSNFNSIDHSAVSRKMMVI